QKEGVDTSGAHSDGKIAQFLVTQSDQTSPLQPDELISKLQSPTVNQKPPDSKEREDESGASQTMVHSRPQTDQDKQNKAVLDELTSAPDADSNSDVELTNKGTDAKEKQSSTDTHPKANIKPEPDAPSSMSESKSKLKVKNAEK